MKIFFQKHQINVSTIPFEQSPFQFGRISNVNVVLVLSQLTEILCRVKFFGIAGGHGHTSCRHVRCIWLDVRVDRWHLAGRWMMQRLMVVYCWIEMLMVHRTHVTGLHVAGCGHHWGWRWWGRHAVFIGTFVMCVCVYCDWFWVQCTIFAFFLFFVLDFGCCCSCKNVWEQLSEAVWMWWYSCRCSRWCGWCNDRK